MPSQHRRFRRTALAAALLAALVLALDTAPAAGATPNDSIDTADGLEFDASSIYYAADISTAGATLEANEPQPCGNIGATLWYRFEVRDHPWSLVVDSTGSDFDTVLAVYETTALPYFPSGLTPLGCNDNAAGAQAKLTVALQPYTYYFVQAGGAGGATGRLRLSMHCDPACRPLSDRPGRYDVPGPAPNQPVAVVDVNTAGATVEPDEPTQCGALGNTVWYGFTAPPEGIAIDAAGSDFPVVLALYVQPNSGPYSLLPLGCATSAGGSAARLRFRSDGSGYYRVQAGGVGGASGKLHLEFSCDPSPCPPYGNIAWAPLSLSVPGEPRADVIDTTNATNDEGEPTGCGGMSHTVWYQLDSTEAATLRVSTDGSSYDTAIALYKINFGGAQPPPPLSGWQADACAPGGRGQRASMQIPMQGEEGLVHWYLQVGSRTGAGGELHVQFDRGTGAPPIGATLTPGAAAITATARAGSPVASAATATPRTGVTGGRRTGVITLPDTGSGGLR